MNAVFFIKFVAFKAMIARAILSPYMMKRVVKPRILQCSSVKGSPW